MHVEPNTSSLRCPGATPCLRMQGCARSGPCRPPLPWAWGGQRLPCPSTPKTRQKPRPEREVLQPRRMTLMEVAFQLDMKLLRSAKISLDSQTHPTSKERFGKSTGSCGKHRLERLQTRVQNRFVCGWVGGCVGGCGCGCGCGGVGVWVCGCVGVWVCGCVGVWVCGCVGVWVCGRVGVGVGGWVGVRTRPRVRTA